MNILLFKLRSQLQFTDGCNKEALHWCEDCESFYCDEHNSQIHAFRRNQNHHVKNANESSKLNIERKVCMKETKWMEYLLFNQDRKCDTHIEVAWCGDCNQSVCIACHLDKAHDVKLFERVRKMSESNVEQFTFSAEDILKTTRANLFSLEKCIQAMKKVSLFSFCFLFLDSPFFK
jgi:hypothetical protein